MYELEPALSHEFRGSCPGNFLQIWVTVKITPFGVHPYNADGGKVTESAELFLTGL